MSVKALLPLIFGLLLLNACSPRANTADLEQKYQNLLFASGCTYFERTLPKDIKPTDWVYLAFVYPDGSLKSMQGVSGQGLPFTSDTVKIYYFTEVSPNGPMLAMQIRDKSAARAILPPLKKLVENLQTPNSDTPLARMNGKPNGDFNDPLMRFSTTGSIRQIGKRSDPIPEGCFDLILYVKAEQPTSAQ
ncbi:MAG: hypothetical protein Q7Q73_13095 [Verrucomicrobiota bacterium JB024]|nr:hypothetical protein [Verrucomicrobiota bacterium JB024]